MPAPKQNIVRLGVLTGGGDCPGINAVLRAVVKSAAYEHGLSVIGIEDGFQGLVDDRLRELSPGDVSGILAQGGTILGTSNTCDPARVIRGRDAAGQPIVENRIKDCLATLDKHRIDALAVIGGDGTMRCAAPLIDAGVPCIGVPKTIDNDIVGTDITFGFTTAFTTATLALDRLHSTAASHHRVMVCEVMGRNAGWLALYSGVASGSDVILIPEIQSDIDAVCKFVLTRRDRHRGFSIVVVAEGARPTDGGQVIAARDAKHPERLGLSCIGERVAALIEQRTGLETRVTVLGHVVRGGAPVAADRILATSFGCRAIDLLTSGRAGRMVAMRQGQLADVDLLEVAGRQRLVPNNDPMIAAARSLKTSFGDDWPAAR